MARMKVGIVLVLVVTAVLSLIEAWAAIAFGFVAVRVEAEVAVVFESRLALVFVSVVASKWVAVVFESRLELVFVSVVASKWVAVAVVEAVAVVLLVALGMEVENRAVEQRH
jgi:hypothetical protein